MAARRMYEQQEMTVAQIGQVFGVSRTTIYRTSNRQLDPAPRRRPATARPAKKPLNPDATTAS